MKKELKIWRVTMWTNNKEKDLFKAIRKQSQEIQKLQRVVVSKSFQSKSKHRSCA